jgi:hypothetical protein
MLRLTPAARHLAGAVWFERKQIVNAGFETAFNFQLTGQGGLGPGADGFAFVLQNSGPEVLGGLGGCSGITRPSPIDPRASWRVLIGISEPIFLIHVSYLLNTGAVSAFSISP